MDRIHEAAYRRPVRRPDQRRQAAGLLRDQLDFAAQPGRQPGREIGEPDYWGGGYGTDALLLLIEYAFDTLDMRKVWLNTMSLNERVIRQMEKVGFGLEGRQREANADGGVR